MATDYRTLQFNINANHSLFKYCNDICLNSKNLYNIANFYIRQCYFGLHKNPSDRNDNENNVINSLNDKLTKINKKKTTTFDERKDYNHKDGRKKKTEPKLLKPLSETNKFLDKGFNNLDCFFREIEQSDYLSLPSQTNQKTIDILYRDWKSFFNANKEYYKNPSKFSGKPKLPKYAKKDGRKIVTHTNQSCKIKQNKDGVNYLIFPKTKLILELGNAPLNSNKLKEVRIIPDSNCYTIELVLSVPKSVVKVTKETSNRIIGIDLGVDNFATISNNIGLIPIIIKGKELKAKNQFYNKQRGHYYSLLRMGKNSNQCSFTSKRLKNIDSNRYAYIKDFFHKKSKDIVNYCVLNNIDTIVIGKNKGWKSNVEMRKNDKQNFISIPYNLFISILTYKANEKGILLIEQEESYTSKASFLDKDKIPTYGEEKEVPVFSGRRIKRGLYKTEKKVLINADVNGASNIIKKCFDKAFEKIELGYLVKSPIKM